MARFEKGDRVRNIEKGWHIPYLTEGTVNENGSKIPYVKWDGFFYDDEGVAQQEEFLELIDPASEIAKILEDSVIPQPTIESYTFSYSDTTREISHEFAEELLEYDLQDVIAEFRLFLLSLGYTADHVGEFIDEDKL